MRIYESLDAGVEQSQLLLHVATRFLQTGQVARPLPSANDWHQQVFTCRAGWDLFAVGHIHRIDHHAVALDRELLVEDYVPDGLTALEVPSALARCQDWKS